MSSDDDAVRLQAAFVFRSHAVERLGTRVKGSDAGLIARAVLALTAPDMPREWAAEPPYPGWSDMPAFVDAAWRVVCATRLSVAGRAIGTVLTTLVDGRVPQISIAPPDLAIPAHWAISAPSGDAAGA